jgi:Transglycosylase SLT domain
VILAFVFAAALAGDRGARPPERSHPVDVRWAFAWDGAAQGLPAATQAAGPTDSSSDPEARRIELILQKMQQDPALREKLYDDVDSLVRAVRNRQPIPGRLKVDYDLPVPEHRQEPGVANLHPTSAILLPVHGMSLPVLQPTLPLPGVEPLPAVRMGRLLSPTGSPLDSAVVNRLIYWARANGCPIQLALATAWRESEMTLHPPRGSSGEIGMMQIMPERARLEGVNPSRLEDPETNMWLGTKLLARYYQQAGNVARAAMMYVAGPNVFERTYGPDLRNYIARYSASVDNYAVYFGTYLNF